MLRITHARTQEQHSSDGHAEQSTAQHPEQQQWTLSGQLAGPWVEELRECWNQHRDAPEEAHFVVDLSDVTFIDEEGEALLCEMRAKGAKFVATGVATKDLVRCLGFKGKRALRRFIAPYISERERSVRDHVDVTKKGNCK